jgi:hypothetical protein
MRTTKAIKNHIYKVTELLTSRLYRDDDWRYVRGLFAAIEAAGYEVFYWCENGGYHSNEYGQQWKDYECEITLDGQSVRGCLRASACGSVSDVWSRYDLTLVLY